MSPFANKAVISFTSSNIECDACPVLNQHRCWTIIWLNALWVVYVKYAVAPQAKMTQLFSDFTLEFTVNSPYEEKSDL